MIALLLWWSCTTEVTPELESERLAIEAWDVGAEALEAGRSDDAVLAFARAKEARPHDPLLDAWMAAALAKAGRTEEAIDVLTLVVQARPDFALARYNRAAYLLRLGRVDDAAPELQRAIVEGATSLGDAVRDPDVRPHLGHPALGFLPATALRVQSDGLPERAFKGTDVSWSVSVIGVGDQPVAITGPMKGPAAWVSVVEERSTRGEGTVELVFALVVEGQGVVDIGPLAIMAGSDRATVPATQVLGVGPEGSVDAPSHDTSLRSPTDWMGSLPLDAPRRIDDRVWVRVDPSSKVVPSPASTPLLKLEVRQDGLPIWVAWAYPASTRKMVVRGIGGERFDGAVEGPAAGG